MKKTLSLRARLAKRREELASKGGGWKTWIFPKPGVYRHRHVPVGDENEFAIECVSFYLGKELGMVVSAKTFGEPCEFYAAYEQLKNSKKQADKDFAEKLKPKKIYLSPSYRYKDEKGKKIDDENGVKLTVLKGDQYQAMIDMFLDRDWDDFTHYKKGYDIKHRRDGVGQFDTKYTSAPCPKNGIAIPKKYWGPYDIVAMVRELIPSKKESKKILEQFLSIPPEEADDKPKKKKKKRSSDI